MNRVLIIGLVLAAAAGLFFLMLGREARDFGAAEKVFRFPLETEPPSLDPVMVTDVTSDGIIQKLFNTLLGFDRDLKLVPELAEAMPEWNPADHSYTFKLRKGVLFHNGREMKAKDVKFSFERLLDPGVSKRTEILAPVKGAQERIDRKADSVPGLEVVDDYTFKIALTGPNPTFLLQLGMICAAVIPEEAVKEAEATGKTFSRAPVGTGPFKFVQWKPNSKLVFRKHDKYFDCSVNLDGLLFEIVPESQVRLDRFMRGEFDVTDIPFGQFKRIQKERPELVSRNPALRTNYLGLVVNKKDKGPDGKPVPADPVGTNPKLRQAINHAVNRQYICDTILESRSVPAKSILPFGMPGHDPNLQGWTYDVAKAKALLAEAGFPEGKGLRTLDLYYRKDNDIEKVVLAIQNDLKAAGIAVELRPLEWSAFLTKVYNDPPDLFYLGWVADFPDPDNFLYWLFHTSQWGEAGNETRYSNPEVDALLERARTSMNEPERMKLYNQAEKKILDEISWVLIEWRVNYILVQPHVKNAREQLGPLDVGQLLNNVDFAKVEIQK